METRAAAHSNRDFFRSNLPQCRQGIRDSLLHLLQVEVRNGTGDTHPRPVHTIKSCSMRILVC